MEIITFTLNDIFTKNAKNIFKNDNLITEIQNATNNANGDYQTNFAMINSKIIGDNPRNIAQKLVENFEQNEVIDRLEIAGPGFINIYLKNSFISEEINKIGNEKYNFDFIDKNNSVIIDYSSPNIAKRMHIGHLRSTIIGDSIKRIYNFIGFKTISDNHIGDWGTQFGKLIVAYNNWLDTDNYSKDPIGELERLYVLFGEKAKEDTNLESQAREELAKLQNKDTKNIALWKEFIDISLKEYNKIYERLDITFDLYLGESFYNDMMPEIIEELKSKNIAKIDDDALVVFFNEEDNLHPCIVQKKDGSFLYSTSDLATIKYRKKEFNPQKSIYVTDARQQDHFKQVFKISDLMDLNYKKDHVWFGIMKFKNQDGEVDSFSSRKGNVIKLVDLLDESKNRVLEIINEKNPSLTNEEKENISERVGLGAIKYFDLSQNKTSDIIFDWNNVLSFEGNTGPYLLYSYARIQSIFRKFNESESNLLSDEIRSSNIVINQEEDKLLSMKLLRFPQSVLKAYEDYKPNLIADYLFELSKIFNSFYNSTHIISEENQELKYSRLNLCEKTSIILKEGLELLGIQTVNKM